MAVQILFILTQQVAAFVESSQNRKEQDPPVIDGPHSVCYFPAITALSLFPSVPPLLPTRSRVAGLQVRLLSES